MDDIDDVDRAILDLLLEDARRPFSDIADRVDLSGPAVSDRVDRLRERGLVEGFTVELDRSMLHAGRAVLLSVTAEPGAGADVQAALAERDEVEHCFRTVDDRLVATATVEDGDLTDLLDRTGVFEHVVEYDVRTLADSAWSPSLGATTLAPECAECGNTVDAEGTSTTLDGETYYFCCRSCESNFVDQYESLREGA